MDEFQFYRNQLWTAPELLRMTTRPINGTQKADVYSFAIILQEIIFRAEPYFANNESPKRKFIGQPFVKRFALCYRSVVCLSCPVLYCLSVCDIRALRPNGWTDKDETWLARRPRPWPHCVTWEPSSPSPKKGAQPPNFRPMSIVAKRLDGSRCHLVRR